MGFRFVFFLSLLSAILLGSGFYVGSRITSVYPAYDSVLVWLAVYAIIILQIAGPFFYRIVPDRQNRFFIARWIMFTCMGIASSMLMYMIMTDVVVFGLTLALPGYKEFISQIGVTSALSLVVLTNVIGMSQVARGPNLYSISIPLPDSLKALDGLRVVQISDLHVGPTIGRSYTEKVVTLVNQQKPHIIALTGDLVDGTPSQLREGIEPLRALVSTYGTFGVLGNHEFYWKAHEWNLEFQTLGIKMLTNEHTVIDHNGAQIVVAGVPDHKACHMITGLTSDPMKAAEGSPIDAFRLLLAHQPSSHSHAEAAGFHLQLSGHTHGGQFFPFSILVHIAEKFVRGLYRFKTLWVYVNRGTGYWGPPVRFLVPAEITLISLHSTK